LLSGINIHMKDSPWFTQRRVYYIHTNFDLIKMLVCPRTRYFFGVSSLQLLLCGQSSLPSAVQLLGKSWKVVALRHSLLALWGGGFVNAWVQLPTDL
jgi:hypothetical protein